MDLSFFDAAYPQIHERLMDLLTCVIPVRLATFLGGDDTLILWNTIIAA